MDIESCAEEQKNEVEVLKSIFYDEFLEIDATKIGNYAIIIKPDEDIFKLTTPPEEEYIRQSWILYLMVNCPETYPNNPPNLNLTLDHPLDPSLTESVDFSHPFALALNAQSELNAWLQNELLSQYTPGMVMIYTMVTAFQEHLSFVLKQKIKNLRDEETAKLLEEEEKESKKFYGTPVTPERFLAWQKQFLLDHPLFGAQTQVDGRLTGRQLFEQDKTLMASDSILLGDDDECVDPLVFDKSDLDEFDNLTLQDDEDSSTVTKLLLQSKD